jgi:predicted transcriptional regulator of viral defense system
MSDIYYNISPVEQMLLDVARDMEPVFTRDLIGALPDVNSQVIRNALASLARKGRLSRVKRGLYLRSEGQGNPIIEEPFRLALALFPGYIAFGSALAFWRLIEYESFTIFIGTRSKSGTKEIGEYTFKAVSMGRRAQGTVFDGSVYVSSLEKTLFDCLYKPHRAGGYPLVAKAISEANPDWQEVGRWFEQLGTPSLRRRAGYILSISGAAPRWLLDDLRGSGDSRIWLDPTGPRRGRYVHDWCLNDNVGGLDAIR